jgi:ADP-ribose pyrophosphatase
MRSTYPFEGRLVTVRVDEFEDDGRSVSREVVEHPGAASVVAITDAEQVVLIRQWRHPVGERLLELPAGIVDPGEEAVSTARRELQEETGFSCDAIWPFQTIAPTPGYSAERIVLCCATGCRRDRGAVDAEQGIEVVLVPAGEAAALLDAERLVDGKTVAGLSWLALHWPHLPRSAA